MSATIEDAVVTEKEALSLRGEALDAAAVALVMGAAVERRSGVLSTTLGGKGWKALPRIHLSLADADLVLKKAIERFGSGRCYECLAKVVGVYRNPEGYDPMVVVTADAEQRVRAAVLAAVRKAAGKQDHMRCLAEGAGE